MYRLKIDGSVKLTDILAVEAPGPLTVSLIDNLILVHHQTQMVTYVYDIAVRGKQSTLKAFVHKPVIQPAQSIAPLSLASNSCLWTIQLDNKAAAQLIPDRVHAVDFLLNRSTAKEVLLDYCANLSVLSCAEAANSVSNGCTYQFHGDGLSSRLDEFSSIFKRFCEIFHQSERRKISVVSGSFSVTPEDGASRIPSLPRKRCNLLTPFSLRDESYSLFSIATFFPDSV
ncbi:unnamed protein product [Echinostoma caproni]|uniref:Mic1 domain-containing protein n=1 Tax=Echinostoma caproni TaxID=27848 RepID=A0A183AWJ3_9TREM|nr:unnamed protein product [Echinostoma caproni]